ncbi:efflux RND transporter periplasmic adaptor subunit [Ancylobacter dichloromethanicus]
MLTIAVLVGAGWLAHEKGWVDVAGIFGVQGEANAAAEPTATPRIPVEVAPARAASVTTDISSIGSLQSDESIKVASEVAGRIQEIRFQEGQHVKAGEVLVQLDAALVKASLDETEARLDLAEANFDRAQRLQKTGSGTARALDEAQAELNTSRALLNSQRVQIAKHTITAPFDGVVGLRSVSNGAYIAVGTELVNLEKIDTLKLDFKVPETQLSSIAEGQTVIITLDALPGRSFFRHDLRHRPDGRHKRPFAQRAGAARQQGSRAAPGPVRPRGGEGKRGPGRRLRAGKRHRATRPGASRLADRRWQGSAAQGAGSASAARARWRSKAWRPVPPLWWRGRGACKPAPPWKWWRRHHRRRRAEAASWASPNCASGARSSRPC